MSRHRQIVVGGLIGLGLLLFSVSPVMAQDDEEPEEEETPTETASSDEGGAGVGSLRRSNRMEFDARLIRGETAGSGAVFLFQRAPRALPSMVPLRKSYLQQSVDGVLTSGWTPPKKKSTTSATTADILESPVVNQGKPSTATGDDQTSTTTTSSSKKKTTSTGKASKKSKKNARKEK